MQQPTDHTVRKISTCKIKQCILLTVLILMRGDGMLSPLSNEENLKGAPRERLERGHFRIGHSNVTETQLPPPRCGRGGRTSSSPPLRVQGGRDAPLAASALASQSFPVPSDCCIGKLGALAKGRPERSLAKGCSKIGKQ